jgi:transposase
MLQHVTAIVVGGAESGERIELPDDVEALKVLVREQRETIAKLEHNIEVFRRLAFGKSSEKRRAARETGISPNQGHLFYAELVAEAEQVAEQTGVEGSVGPSETSPKPRKKGGRRKKYPSHLPVIRTTYELKPEDRKCEECGADLHEISEDVRREIERIELSIVHEIACKKYGCRSCSGGVRTAPGPERVIEKGILGKGFLAHVLIERFGNHMPYHRLEKKYGAEGFDLSRSVLQRSMTKVGELLEPIWQQVRRDVIDSGIIFTDDTPVTIAQAGTGSSRQGRVWIYLDRQGRHFYDFTDSRKRDGPLEVLGDFEGLIHADAYAGYDEIFLPGGATEVACWAHARRKFVDAESSDPDLSKEGIDLIRKLYVIEKRGKNLSDDERAELRRKESKPVLAEVRAWLELTDAKVLPKSPMAKAIGYALRQWDALNVFADDGRLSIDNNAAERALRSFAVGRKNWLFFQRDTGGRTAVILASLLRTALAVGIDAGAYFRDVMARISHETDVEKLTPHGWKQHYEAEVKDRRDEILHRILGG